MRTTTFTFLPFPSPLVPAVLSWCPLLPRPGSSGCREAGQLPGKLSWCCHLCGGLPGCGSGCGSLNSGKEDMHHEEWPSKHQDVKPGECSQTLDPCVQVPKEDGGNEGIQLGTQLQPDCFPWPKCTVGCVEVTVKKGRSQVFIRSTRSRLGRTSDKLCRFLQSHVQL
jgi:hypothetical protein